MQAVTRTQVSGSQAKALPTQPDFSASLGSGWLALVSTGVSASLNTGGLITVILGSHKAFFSNHVSSQASLPGIEEAASGARP